MPNDNEEIRRLLQENLAITKETRELLRKMHRVNVWSFWARVLWIAVLIGVPFVIYYFVIEPYISALGVRTEEFRAGITNFIEFFRSPWGSFRGE